MLPTARARQIEADRQGARMSLDAMAMGRTFGLFFLTAIAELVGCYLPLLWLSGKGGV